VPKDVSTDEAEIWTREGGNAYLFSSLGPPPAVRVATVPRTWLVLIASGVVFLAGALLLKLPWLRRREVLFVAAVMLTAIALLYPEPSVLVAQAASLGLLAMVGVVALKRGLAIYRPLLVGGSTTASGKALRGSSLSHRSAMERPALAVGSSRTANPLAASAAPVAAPQAAKAEPASSRSARVTGVAHAGQGGG
jgi:hypothetical protein